MTTNSPDMLSDDSFVRGVIYRKVSKLIATSGFTLQDQKDLTQEVYVRSIKSLELFDPEVGHLYPFVCTIVQRHLKNILRDRLVHKRSSKPGVSLSKVVRGEEGSSAELSHMLRDEDQDRRLGRERRLGEEDLNALRMDLGALISQLPPELQDLLDRRKTQSIAEIARDTNIPRSTLNDWMIQIRNRFESAGIDGYLEK